MCTLVGEMRSTYLRSTQGGKWLSATFINSDKNHGQRDGEGWPSLEWRRTGAEREISFEVDQARWELGGWRVDGNASSCRPRAVLEGDSADDSQAGGEGSCWRTVTWRLI